MAKLSKKQEGKSTGAAKGGNLARAQTDGNPESIKTTPGEHTMETGYGTLKYRVVDGSNDVVTGNAGVKATVERIQQQQAPGMEGGGVIARAKAGPLADYNHDQGWIAVKLKNENTGSNSWSRGSPESVETQLKNFFGVKDINEIEI